MKYFIDTEFVEGPQKESFPISLFRKETPNTIDLISIGIVAEDGREYYAISKDFNLKEAWNSFDIAEQTLFEKQNGFKGRKVYWLRENVLKPIFYELMKKDVDYLTKGYLFLYSDFKKLLNRYGKTNTEIADKVKYFCSIGTAYSSSDRSIATILHFPEQDEYTRELIQKHNITEVYSEIPEFYAYYADYDWVVFCWLFGKMMDLPKGFPMYCKDLKQIIDVKIDTINYEAQLRSPGCPMVTCTSMKENNPNYPKQDTSKSHNAIEDARWNKQLFEFLNNL